MKALCGLAFALIISLAVPSGVIEAEEIEKTNTIERFNHPETSLVYPMLLNSGKSPKQAKEEIRRGMIEYDVMKAELIGPGSFWDCPRTSSLSRICFGIPAQPGLLATVSACR